MSAKGASPAACGSAGKFLVTWDAGGNAKAAVIDAATGMLSLPVGRKQAKPDGRINPICGSNTAIAADDQANFMTVSAREGYPNPWGWPGRRSTPGRCQAWPTG